MGSTSIASGKQLRKLTPVGVFYEFGSTVAIAGSKGLIGSYSDAIQFDINTGQQVRVLTQLDPEIGNDNFSRFAMATSGSIALIGDELDSNNTLLAGAAYVFDLTTGQQLFKLTASDIAANMRFGSSVAIDGDIGIIGTGGGGSYIFNLTTGQQINKLAATSDSIALSGDRALIGPRVFDVATGKQLATLAATDTTPNSAFGWSVALEGDTALIGSYGAAYVFDISNVPEPSTLLISAFPLVALIGRRRGRNQSATVKNTQPPPANES